MASTDLELDAKTEVVVEKGDEEEDCDEASAIFEFAHSQDVIVLTFCNRCTTAATVVGDCAAMSERDAGRLVDLLRSDWWRRLAKGSPAAEAVPMGILSFRGSTCEQPRVSASLIIFQLLNSSCFDV